MPHSPFCFFFSPTHSNCTIDNSTFEPSTQMHLSTLPAIIVFSMVVATPVALGQKDQGKPSESRRICGPKIHEMFEKTCFNSQIWAQMVDGPRSKRSGK